MPDVAPSDTIQTLSYFQAPRVFVQPGDKRLKTDPMYMAADDTIKDYCCTPEARGAITHLLLDAYGPPVRTKQMNTMRDEFSAGADEREKFFEAFEATGSADDFVPVKEGGGAPCQEREAECDATVRSGHTRATAGQPF
eukprot:COSAG02_NODE_1588_length_11795_cov_1295.418348_10_plen_139_part_00